MATVASGSSGSAPLSSATVWPVAAGNGSSSAVATDGCRLAARGALAARRSWRLEQGWTRITRVVECPADGHDHRIGVTLAQHTGTGALGVGIEGGQPHEQSIGIETVGDSAAFGTSRSLAQPGHCGAS